MQLRWLPLPIEFRPLLLDLGISVATASFPRSLALSLPPSGLARKSNHTFVSLGRREGKRTWEEPTNGVS